MIIGLDRYKIGEIGKRDYGIELSRYMQFFNKYENKMLEQQNRRLEANK